jgi:ferritin-like metal-binding protein YciE
MKTKINSLHDALTFLLQGLYFTETKLREEFPVCCSDITSTRIRNEIDNYTSNTDNKLLKLERVFNYLMKEPLTRTNEVVIGLMAESHQMLASTTSSHIKDFLSIGCIQNINAYKITNYRSAYMIAVELELDTPTDLLQQILEWEVETSQALTELSIEEFNKAQRPTAK